MILAIIHHKGGTGKTTSAVNLVGEVIRRGGPHEA
jgi:cellulose biosynthesis protein BcsQ